MNRSVTSRRASLVGQWEFEDRGSWYAFSSADSQTISTAAAAGSKTCTVTNSYGTYDITLNAFHGKSGTQRNRSSSNTRRIRFHIIQNDADKGKWSCPRCTFVNLSSKSKCAICEGDRPKGGSKDDDDDTGDPNPHFPRSRGVGLQRKMMHLMYCLSKHKTAPARDVYNWKQVLVKFIPWLIEITPINLSYPHGAVTDAILQKNKTKWKLNDGSLGSAEKGAIWYIGTKGDTTNGSWSNPGRGSPTQVTTSVGMLVHDNHHKKSSDNLLRDNVTASNKIPECLARSCKSGIWILGDATRHPYFEIDLGKGRAIVPTCYAILDGNAGSAFRTWELQGSEDGTHFFVLRRHVNDTFMPSNLKKGVYALHPSMTRALTKGSPSDVQHKKSMPACRAFRIVKTAVGGSNSWYLGLSGFEVFGQYSFNSSLTGF